MSEIVGQRMSDYTEIDDASLTSTEKAYYKANARVTTFGKVDDEASTPNSNYNIPLSEIAGEALPPIEAGDAGKVLTVNTNEDGVQWSEGSISYDSEAPIAITSYFGGDQKIELKYNSDDFAVSADGELNLVTPIPEIGEDDHRGQFLKVADNSDNLVWDTIPTAPTYTAGTGIDITSNAISVTLPVPDPGTNDHRGHVLTVNNSDDSIVWAAPQGGGGSDPFAGMASWESTFDHSTLAEYFADPDHSSSIDDCELKVNVKADGGIVKRQYLFNAGSAAFVGPWAS